MNVRDDEMEIDLLEVFMYLKDRILIILAAGIVLAALSGVVTKCLITPTYSSTSKLYILSRSTSLTSLADIQIGTSLTKDYVQLVQSRPVVDQVIENLSLNRTYEAVLKQMTFTNPSDTRILVITAEDEDPQLAKDLVDEFANVSKARIAAIMQTDEPTIAEEGYITGIPVSPNFMKNVVIGGAAGVFLACALFVVLFLLDDSVKSAEDIEKYLGLNTLTEIPLREGEVKSKKKRIRKYGKGEHRNGK